MLFPIYPSSLEDQTSNFMALRLLCPFITPNNDLHILTRCVQINSLPGKDHNGQRRRQPCHFHAKSFDIREYRAVSKLPWHNYMQYEASMKLL